MKKKFSFMLLERCYISNKRQWQMCFFFGSGKLLRFLLEQNQTQNEGLLQNQEKWHVLNMNKHAKYCKQKLY